MLGLQGLIWTAGAMWNLAHFLNIPIHIQEVSVPRLLTNCSCELVKHC